MIIVPFGELLSTIWQPHGGTIYSSQFSSNYFDLSLPSSARSTTSQAGVNGLKSSKSRAMAAEDKFQAPPSAHHPRRQVHQFLHDSFYSAPFGGMTHGSFSGNKPQLSDGAQEVVHQSTKSQDQGIGGEFTRWEPLQVHVGFDLGMKLLACAMVLIEPDHSFSRQIKGGPPSLDFDLRLEKTLPAPVDGALHCTHYPLKDVGFSLVDLSNVNSEQSNPFAVPWSGDVTFFENPGRPCRPVFSSRIPFDDIADISLTRQRCTGIKGVVGRVEPHKDFSGSEAAGFLNNPLKKRGSIRPGCVGFPGASPVPGTSLRFPSTPQLAHTHHRRYRFGIHPPHRVTVAEFRQRGHAGLPKIG